MSSSGGERLVVALASITCMVAAVSYLSAIPRTPPRPLISPPAAAGPTAQKAAPQPKPDLTATLSVTLWPNGPGRGRVSWTLECPPMTDACKTALARSRLLRAELPGPCREARTGKAEAVVVGRVSGTHVAAWLDRRDGCGVARWQRLLPVVTAPSPPSGGDQSRQKLR